MTNIGALRQAADRSLTVDLNKSGQASFTLPTSAPNASDIWPWETCIVAQYDDTWVWSGPVSRRSISMKSGRMTVSSVGWFDKLMHLNIQEKLTFTDLDAGEIATQLLGKALEQDSTVPVKIGSVELSQLRTITYEAGHNIGQAIMELSELEAGFDWYIDPVTRMLNIVPRLGQDRRSCKWLFLADNSRQSNLDDCVEDVSGEIVNDIRVKGKYATAFDQDGVSKARYGVFQEAPSLLDVVDTNILAAYAGAELAYRSEPRITYTLTPKPSTKASVPKLFRDFNIGDTTYLTARRDFVNVVDQAERVFGATLNIRNDDSFTLTNLQTTAS
jgi:hypothetical protein